MILWRIYTERKNMADILKYAIHLFPHNGITFLHSLGIWQGSKEDSLIIEYIGTADDEILINSLALLIKAYNEQEVVLITSQELLTHKLI